MKSSKFIDSSFWVTNQRCMRSQRRTKRPAAAATAPACSAPSAASEAFEACHSNDPLPRIFPRLVFGCINTLLFLLDGKITTKFYWNSFSEKFGKSAFKKRIISVSQ